jgi:hypothetical protein
VGTADNLAPTKTLTQRHLERFERQKQGLQAFVDAGAVTQREADELLATIHPANWGKNDPPWPTSWITKLSDEQKALWIGVAQQAEAQYEPARKPPRWMRDLLGEDQ